jgi:hypothetical protein
MNGTVSYGHRSRLAEPRAQRERSIASMTVLAADRGRRGGERGPFRGDESSDLQQRQAVRGQCVLLPGRDARKLDGDW